MGNFWKNFCKNRGDGLYEKGSYQKALNWYIRSNNDEGIGKSHLALENYSDALSFLVKAEDYANAAQAALKSNDIRKAAEYFVKSDNAEQAVDMLVANNDISHAIRIAEENKMQTKALELYLQTGEKGKAALIYLELGEYDKAIEIFKELDNTDGLLKVYIAKGNPKETAENCLKENNKLLAAKLFEHCGESLRAADIFVELKDLNRAFELYEKAGAKDKMGEIYEKQGQLYLAAAAYEEAPNKYKNAGKIYEQLTILSESETTTFDSNIISGVFAAQADAAVLGTLNQEILYTTKSFDECWRFKVSEEGHPTSLAISADGKLIAAATDHKQLYLINDEKTTLWEKAFKAPIQGLAFLPDGSGIVAAMADEIICMKLDEGLKWEKTVDFKAWTIDTSTVKNQILIGTLGGSVYLYDCSGRLISENTFDDKIYKIRFSRDGNHFVAAIGDNKLAMYTMNFCEMWSIEHQGIFRYIDFIPQSYLLAAAGNKDIALLHINGKNNYINTFDEKILCGFSNGESQKIAVCFNDRKIKTYTLNNCKQKAAECLEKAEAFQEAAKIYCDIENYQRAYDLFKEVGDYENAAKTMQLTGDIATAAKHYEVVGKYDKAAALYEELEMFPQAAKCYGKANRYNKAAEIFARLDDHLLAADFFERSKDFKQAGLLYAKVKQNDQAIHNLETYATNNPEDKEISFALGDLYYQADRMDEAIKLLQKTH